MAPLNPDSILTVDGKQILIKTTDLLSSETSFILVCFFSVILHGRDETFNVIEFEVLAMRNIRYVAFLQCFIRLFHLINVINSIH